MKLNEELNQDSKPRKSRTTRKGRAIRSGRTEQARLLDDICFGGDRKGVITNYLDAFRLPWGFQSVEQGAYQNIVVGSGTNRIFGAHYDVWQQSQPGEPILPGANDNAASVVALLGAAKRGLADNSSIVFFDAEELGGIGSRAFAADLKAKSIQPELFVVLDIIGYGNLTIRRWGGGPGCQTMHEQVEKALGHQVPVRATPPSDDEFMRPYVESILLCTLPEDDLHVRFPEWWHSLLHSPNDTPATVDPANIEKFTDLASKLLS